MITYVKGINALATFNASFSDVKSVAHGDWSFTRTAVFSILNRLKQHNATYASIC